MTRNDLILAIEKRIGLLLDVMKVSKGITDEGLPYQKNTEAFYEWKLLKETSEKLQGMFLRYPKER
jgi:hypothetical protein